MRLVCISDTHDLHARLELPDGDVLVHCGDFTNLGEEREIAAFDAWLARQPHRHKLVIAGNHDVLFERAPQRARALLENATYLEDSGAEVDGLRVWGSPWQPRFFEWAFNLERGPQLRAKWDLIPAGTELLITHGPPHGILDRNSHGLHVGCEELLAAVERIAPKVHLFGHIHEGRGTLERGATRFVNACSVRLHADLVFPPIVLDV